MFSPSLARQLMLAFTHNIQFCPQFFDVWVSHVPAIQSQGVMYVAYSVVALVQCVALDLDAKDCLVLRQAHGFLSSGKRYCLVDIIDIVCTGLSSPF